jgi:hypothetical protein
MNEAGDANERRQISVDPELAMAEHAARSPAA